MSFIGIAIFTVYTTVTGYTLSDCDPKWAAKCTHREVDHEVGRKEPVYVGEYPTLKACTEATGKAKYKPKNGERVETWWESMCPTKGDETIASLPVAGPLYGIDASRYPADPPSEWVMVFYTGDHDGYPLTVTAVVPQRSGPACAHLRDELVGDNEGTKVGKLIQCRDLRGDPLKLRARE